MRKQLILASLRLRRPGFRRHYNRCLELERNTHSADAVRLQRLTALLAHCEQSVPYYARIMKEVGDDYRSNPYDYLSRLPILTKEHIRNSLDALTSRDLAGREWFYNTSGGSTGEPVRFVQDRDFVDSSIAITHLFSTWTGKDIGDSELRLWGSERDVFVGTQGIKAHITNILFNQRILNAFQMTPARMREYLEVINRRRPCLIVAYAQAIYELARFAERENVSVVPQHAIMTSAGTLYKFMSEKLGEVFGAPVFNRYGSREVGDIASQCEARKCLHVSPYGNYIEIVDEDGRVVTPGQDGDIVITSLQNYAMPLIRYRIGDRGRLCPSNRCECGREGQMLATVLGRNVDAFRTTDGGLIDGEYFTHLLYFRQWVKQFQIVQTAVSAVEFRIVRSGFDPAQDEIDEIVRKTQLVLGSCCRVDICFVDEISPSASGKFRYTISEVAQ